MKKKRTQWFDNKAKGLCGCGRQRMPDRSPCQGCYSKQKEYAQSQKAKGLCRMCLEPMYMGRTHCYFHVAYSIAHCRLGSGKHTTFILDILTKQNKKCVYCGTDIELCINAELDHIKPVRHFPELKKNLNNVQWLCFYCNASKLERTETEFLKWIQQVSVHRSIYVH